MSPLFTWLDNHFFPAFKAIVTHRLFILGLLILGVLLMVFDNPVFQLKMGNFTNVTSAVLGCIVLLESMTHRRESRQHAATMRDMQTAHLSALAALQESHDALHAKVDALTPPEPPPPASGTLTVPMPNATGDPATIAAAVSKELDKRDRANYRAGRRPGRVKLTEVTATADATPADVSALPADSPTVTPDEGRAAA